MKKLSISILFLFIILGIKAQDNTIQSNNLKETGIIRLDSIKSFKDLTEKFKGKVIYIDIMASWCKPCIEELKSHKQLEEYFNENNIVKIFISIDQKEHVDTCVSLLRRYEINGYFITQWTAGTEFNKELMNKFLTDENGNITISIPRYSIIDKNGDFVEMKAQRPSSFQSLKTQLSKYL